LSKFYEFQLEVSNKRYNEEGCTDQFGHRVREPENLLELVFGVALVLYFWRRR